MRRALKVGLAGLAAVLAGVVAIPAVLLFTETGGRWLLDQVPGLAVEGFDGTLGGRWSATRLSWQQALPAVRDAWERAQDSLARTGM